MLKDNFQADFVVLINHYLFQFVDLYGRMLLESPVTSA